MWDAFVYCQAHQVIPWRFSCSSLTWLFWVCCPAAAVELPSPLSLEPPSLYCHEALFLGPHISFFFGLFPHWESSSLKSWISGKYFSLASYIFLDNFFLSVFFLVILFFIVLGNTCHLDAAPPRLIIYFSCFLFSIFYMFCFQNNFLKFIFQAFNEIFNFWYFIFNFWEFLFVLQIVLQNCIIFLFSYLSQC